MSASDGDLWWINALLAMLVHGLILVIVIWDIWVTVNHGPSYTVSAMVLKWSKVYPVLPFMAGAIAAHFFWPQ